MGLWVADQLVREREGRGAPLPDPEVALGVTRAPAMDVTITDIKPVDEHHVQLTAQPYAPRVHDERRMHLMDDGADFDPTSVPDPRPAAGTGATAHG